MRSNTLRNTTAWWWRPADGGASIALVSRPSGPAGSADFKGAIDSGWSVVVGGTSPFAAPVVVDDERLEWTLGAAESQDPGTSGTTPGINTTRIVKTLGNGDWQMTVKIDGTPATYDPAFGGMGFFFGDSGLSNTGRVEIYNQAGNDFWLKYVQTGSTVRGSGATGFGGLQGAPSFLRLDKTGTTMTFSASWDGSFTDEVVIQSWTESITIDTAGFYFYHITPSAEAKAQIDYIHVDGHNLPTLDSEPVRTVQLDEAFSDLLAFHDDSQNGGSVSVAAGVLTLTTTATSLSAARLATTANYGPDVGVVFRYRDGGTALGSTYLAVGLRGQQFISTGRWANQYSADRVTAYEGNPANDLVRIIGNDGPTADADGGKFRGNWYEANTGKDPGTDWVWVRMEVIGPFIRFRTWYDSESEPSTWALEDTVDEFSRARGPVGIAMAHNVGATEAGSIELTDLDIYHLTAAGAAPAEEDLANRTLFTFEDFSDGQFPASGMVLDAYHPEGDITFKRQGAAVECDKVDNPFTGLGYTASFWNNHLNSARGLISEQTYSSIPDRLKLAGATDFTVEWYSQRGASNAFNAVFGMWDGTLTGDTGREWLVGINNLENMGFYHMTSGGQQTPTGSTPPSSATFVHHAVCVSGGVLQMWQDGARVYNAAIGTIRAAPAEGYWGLGCTAQGVAGAANSWFPGTTTHQPRLGPIHIWKGFAKYDGAIITPDFPINPA